VCGVDVDAVLADRTRRFVDEVDVQLAAGHVEGQAGVGEQLVADVAVLVLIDERVRSDQGVERAVLRHAGRMHAVALQNQAARELIEVLGELRQELLLDVEQAADLAAGDLHVLARDLHADAAAAGIAADRHLLDRRRADEDAPADEHAHGTALVFDGAHVDVLRQFANGLVALIAQVVGGRRAVLAADDLAVEVADAAREFVDLRRVGLQTQEDVALQREAVAGKLIELRSERHCRLHGAGAQHAVFRRRRERSEALEHRLEHRRRAAVAGTAEQTLDVGERVEPRVDAPDARDLRGDVAGEQRIDRARNDVSLRARALHQAAQIQRRRSRNVQRLARVAGRVRVRDVVTNRLQARLRSEQGLQTDVDAECRHGLTPRR
jgi:hypothetical protein